MRIQDWIPTFLTPFAPPSEAPAPRAHCALCHRSLRRGQATLDLRGGVLVHENCATYRPRRRTEPAWRDELRRSAEGSPGSTS
ncbi:MAG: hypothetical protein QOK31_862 [Solirubrobacteraceae bacterium]|jgi:hypothetical protein|nr:hypothetical protein [Solirubrobacteraceae bacterium]